MTEIWTRGGALETHATTLSEARLVSESPKSLGGIESCRKRTISLHLRLSSIYRSRMSHRAAPQSWYRLRSSTARICYALCLIDLLRALFDNVTEPSMDPLYTGQGRPRPIHRVQPNKHWGKFYCHTRKPA